MVTMPQQLRNPCQGTSVDALRTGVCCVSAAGDQAIAESFGELRVHRWRILKASI
jgi:hypothetical protein